MKVDREDLEVPKSGAELDNYLRTLDEDEISALRLDLQEELGAIKLQIQTAQQLARETGNYSDGDWYRRAHGARTVKSNQYNALCAELRRRRIALAEETKAADAARKVSFHRAFVIAAKKALDSDTFERISMRAEEIATEGVEA